MKLEKLDLTVYRQDGGKIVVKCKQFPKIFGEAKPNPVSSCRNLVTEALVSFVSRVENQYRQLESLPAEYLTKDAVEGRKLLAQFIKTWCEGR